MHIRVQLSVDGVEVEGEFDVAQDSPAWRQRLVSAITTHSRSAAEHLEAQIADPPALASPGFVPLEFVAPTVG